PGRKIRRRRLLKKYRTVDAIREALHTDRPPLEIWQHRRSDPFVIADEIALGDPVFRKQDLFGTCDLDRPDAVSIRRACCGPHNSSRPSLVPRHCDNPDTRPRSARADASSYRWHGYDGSSGT